MNAATWTIRAAEPADAIALAALLPQRGVVEGVMQTPWDSADQNKAMFSDPPKDRCGLVAVAEGRLIGYAAVTPHVALRRRHAGWLMIFIAPQWQGRGVGKSLMAALLDWADRWSGLLRLELTVNVDNAAAIALYRRCGFEIEATMRADALRDGAYVDGHAMARLHPAAPSLPSRAPAA